MADLQDPRIATRFQVLGLISKVASGPWMSLVYGSRARLFH